MHADHLNTPRLITDASQQVVWRWDQAEPFGDSPPDENPSGLGTFEFPSRFDGTYADRETNLLYNWHRYLDQARGEYLQSDPIGLRGGLNTYLHVDGNPLSKIDPLGLIPSGADPECFRRGECKCATAECAAGLPPLPPPSKPICCDDQKLLVCLAPAANTGNNCVNCVKSKFTDQRACQNCYRGGAGIATCFELHCGKDKCPEKKSCLEPSWNAI